MFSFSRNFIKVNEDVFLIKKTYREDMVKDIEPIKEWLGSDHVFKKDGIMYFCEKVQELEIITE